MGGKTRPMRYDIQQYRKFDITRYDISKLSIRCPTLRYLVYCYTRTINNSREKFILLQLWYDTSTRYIHRKHVKRFASMTCSSKPSLEGKTSKPLVYTCIIIKYVSVEDRCWESSVEWSPHMYRRKIDRKDILSGNLTDELRYRVQWPETAEPRRALLLIARSSSLSLISPQQVEGSLLADISGRNIKPPLVAGESYVPPSLETLRQQWGLHTWYWYYCGLLLWYRRMRFETQRNRGYIWFFKRSSIKWHVFAPCSFAQHTQTIRVVALFQRSRNCPQLGQMICLICMIYSHYSSWCRSFREDRFLICIICMICMICMI